MVRVRVGGRGRTRSGLDMLMNASSKFRFRNSVFHVAGFELMELGVGSALGLGLVSGLRLGFGLGLGLWLGSELGLGLGLGSGFG